MIREGEATLRAVAAERDSALVAAAGADAALAQAQERLAQAQRAEEENAERQAALDALQQEAGEVAQSLRAQQREQQRELVAARRAQRAAAASEEGVAAREAALAERQADAERAEAEALALKRSLAEEQAALERQHATLAQRAADVEAAQARLERQQAALTQEQAALVALRAQRLEEQQAALSSLAEERAAAAQQQGEAERAMDAAHAAEQSAARVLASLQARADAAVRAADCAERRLEGLATRCAEEEARLAALASETADHQRSWDEQARALTELGRQVKERSDEVAAAYEGLAAARAEVQEERARMTAAARAAAAEARSLATQREEAEEARRELADRQAALAAERRKLAEERAQALQAAERVRLAQAAATQAGTPQPTLLPQEMAAVWGSVHGSLPVAPLPAQMDRLPSAQPHALSLDEPPAPAMPPEGSGAAAAAATAATAAQPPAPAPEDGRYRALLADLESSVVRWQAQLRAGQPLTLPSHLPGFHHAIGLGHDASTEVGSAAGGPPSPVRTPASQGVTVQMLESNAMPTIPKEPVVVSVPSPAASKKKGILRRKDDAPPSQQWQAGGNGTWPTEALPVGHSAQSETVLLSASYLIPARREAGHGGEDGGMGTGGIDSGTPRRRPKTSSWHSGIFSFRRSTDGGSKGGSRRRPASEDVEVADFSIPASGLR